MVASMFNGKPRIFGKPGERRVVLDDPANVLAVVDTLCERHAQGELLHLTVSRMLDSDLAFLRDLPFLEGLSLSRCTGSTLSHLPHCGSLRDLFLSDGYGAFDFSALPLLESLQANEWCAQWRGLDSLTHLRLLDAREVRLKRLEDLPLPDGLRSLRLLTTSLETLEGIERLRALRSLSLAYSPRVVSLDPVARLPALGRVSLSHLKRVTSYAALGSCPDLLEIEVVACAPLPSVSWIAGLPALCSLNLLRTDIADGDLSPIARHEGLLWVELTGKRHFQPPAADVVAISEQRRRDRGFGTKDDAARLGLLPKGMGILESDWAGL